MRRRSEALELVRLPADPRASIDGLGAAGLKKLELARALATQPQLLLADESLGGLDEHEMEQAADLLAAIRAQRGITIIWVEHIMGVLMRVVDRCVVLDHGEVIAAGKPAGRGARPESDRGLPGHRRGAKCRPPIAERRALMLQAGKRLGGLRQLPGAVRHQPRGQRRRDGGGDRAERRRQDHAAARDLAADRPARRRDDHGRPAAERGALRTR